MSKESGIAGEVDAGGVIGAGAGGLRGRGGAAFACDAVAGWAEVSRVKSSRMFRAASQPDKSNSPIATVCLARLLIVIPAYPKTFEEEAVRDLCDPITAQTA